MKRRRVLDGLVVIGLLASLCLGLAGCSSSVSQPEQKKSANLMEGKTIEWYTPNPPGDINDIAARLYQPFVQKNLPGSRITVVNEPGAGGITAYNAVYNHGDVAITSCLASAMFAFEYISKDPAVKFKVKDFKWLAYLDDDTRILVTGAKSGYRSIDDFLNAAKQGKKLSTGTYGKGGTAWNEAVALDYSLGLGLKFVPGYSSSQLLMALLQGEVDCTCGSYASYKSYISSGEMYPILVLEEKRSEYFPDVPTVYEVLDKLDKPADTKAMALAMLRVVSLPKLIAANPKVTDEQWAYLQTAFNNTIADPEFVKVAKDAGLNIPHRTGYQIRDMVNEFIGSFEKTGATVVGVFNEYLQKTK